MALPEPQVGDLLQFQLIYFLDDQTCINVFHYSVGARTPGTGGPNVADVALHIGDDLWDDATHGLCNAVSGAVGNVTYACQVIKPVRTIAATAGPTVNQNGLLAQPAMPSGVAVVVRRNGNIANRHNRGRVYVAGIFSGDVVGSAITPFSPTDLAMSAFGAQLPKDQTVTKGGVVLTLASVLCPLPAGTPIVPLQGFSVDRTLRYQRRRELRVGI